MRLGLIVCVVVALGHVDAARAAPPPDCEAALDNVMTSVVSAFMAKDTIAARKNAVKKWPAVPEACHTAQWYLQAALIINAGETELTAGDVKIATEEAALMLAMQQADDVDVLVRIALINVLGRKPALPKDACKRAQAIDKGDRAAYVCARVAISKRDGKSAKKQLATITLARRFPDYELTIAQAAKLNKDTKTMKAQASLAAKLNEDRAEMALINEADHNAIIDLAKKLK
jgi:hypothetical protein